MGLGHAMSRRGFAAGGVVWGHGGIVTERMMSETMALQIKNHWR
jgi:hypothetical protein